MRFRGRLKLPGERGEGVVVDIRLDDIFLEVMAGAEELGRWRMDDVTIERLVSNEFALNLDGEPVVFIADDALAFAYEGVAAIGEVAARLTKKRRGLRRKPSEVTDGVRTPPPIARALRAGRPAGRTAGGEHRSIEPPAPAVSRSEPPAAVEPPVEPPAAAVSRVEPPAAAVSPVEPPAVVEPPAAARVDVPAVVEPPAAAVSRVEPPAVVEPPAAARVDVPAVVDPPAAVEPPVAVEPPAAAVSPVEPPAVVEPPAAAARVDVPAVVEPPAVESPAEAPPGFVPRSPWIVPDDGAPDGDGADESRRSADPPPPAGDPVSPWILPAQEEAPAAGAGPALPEVLPTVADEEGAGTFAAEVAVIDLTEPVEPGDAMESNGANGQPSPLAVVLPLHPATPVVVPEHPASGTSGGKPSTPGSARTADAALPPAAPAEARARPVPVAPAPAARREVERGGLFGRRRARSPEPHEHAYEEGGTVGGITRRVCTVCGHVSFLGADVYEGWQ